MRGWVDWGWDEDWGWREPRERWRRDSTSAPGAWQPPHAYWLDLGWHRGQGARARRIERRAAPAAPRSENPTTPNAQPPAEQPAPGVAAPQFPRLEPTPKWGAPPERFRPEAPPPLGAPLPQGAAWLWPAPPGMVPVWVPRPDLAGPPPPAPKVDVTRIADVIALLRVVAAADPMPPLATPSVPPTRAPEHPCAPLQEPPPTPTEPEDQRQPEDNLPPAPEPAPTEPQPERPRRKSHNKLQAQSRYTQTASATRACGRRSTSTTSETGPASPHSRRGALARASAPARHLGTPRSAGRQQPPQRGRAWRRRRAFRPRRKTARELRTPRLATEPSGLKRSPCPRAA
jgi:hypothetical protein